MMRCFYLILFSATAFWSCQHETKDGFSAYNPGLCYQPLYWPSECVQPDPPTAREVTKARRAYLKRKSQD